MSAEKHPLEGKGLVIITGDEIGPGKSTLLSSGIRMILGEVDRVTYEVSEPIEYVYDGTMLAKAE